MLARKDYVLNSYFFGKNRLNPGLVNKNYNEFLK